MLQKILIANALTTGLAVFLAIVAAVWLVYEIGRRLLRDSVIGTLLRALSVQIQSGERELQLQEPKSLRGMDSLLAPRIAKDFPTLNLDRRKSAANATLRRTLESLTVAKVLPLELADIMYREQLRSEIQNNAAEGIDVTYRDVKIHKTVISDYQKRDGLCRIRFQMAFQAKYEERRDDEVIAGDAAGVTQRRATLSLIYIQDLSKCDSKYQTAFTANCPNCGAPLEELGSANCVYCGSPLDPVHLRVWRFNDYDIE